MADAVTTASISAPAKVNLFLRVFDARPDGYHELETLFQAIDLADDVRVERRATRVELEVVGADLGPKDANLAYRAAARLLEHGGIDGGLAVTLTKRIPVGAGLGGGSSDAAAVLRCGAALVGIPAEAPLLNRLAAELGSDVPFFLGPDPIALGRGRGEVLEGIPPLPAANLVLVTPPVHVSTAWAYRALDDARRSGGAGGGAALSGRPRGWADVAAMAHNDFQRVVAAAHPEVARSLEALIEAGAEWALLSGSGSASFGLFSDGLAAERAAEELTNELGWLCRAVRTLSALPAPRLG